MKKNYSLENVSLDKMAIGTSLEQRTVEPIVLGNLALDGEAVRGSDGEYLLKTQQGWMNHLAGSVARLPTLPEYFAFIHHLQKENRPASEGLLQDLKKSYLCIGTQFGYHNKKNAITHFGDEPRVIPCAIPEEYGYLDNLVKDNNWRIVVQTALGHLDADEVIEVLQRFSGKRPYIWTALAGNRKSHPERAVWLYCYSGRFVLSCDDNLIDDYGVGRARRVRRLEGLEGCAAPCAEQK